MICNYADNNHLVNESNPVDTLKVSLEKDAHCAISWLIIIIWMRILTNFSAFLLTGLAGLLYPFRLMEILSHLLIVLKY